MLYNGGVKEALRLMLSLALCQAVGFLGLVFMPLEWVFGLAWAFLHALLGISLYLVWRQKNAKGGECNVCETMSLFLLQLALGVVWAYLFFTLREPLFAFAEIIFLFIVVLLTMWRFWSFSKAAVYLLMPYAAWVAFAAILNGAIWKLHNSLE